MRKLSPFLLALFACMMFIIIRSVASVSAQGTPGDLPVPGLVGDFVWHDLNKNGRQDSDEPGIPNLTIYLLQNDTITRTTTTDDGGVYFFDELPAGIYTIQVDLLSIPYTGYYFTLEGEGGGDSMADATGRIQDITLDEDTVDLTQDIGIVLNGGVIGNLIWLDEDGNGDQDPGESGLANIMIELLDDQGNLVDQTLSDLDGGYIFRDLFGENYTVRIDPDSLPSGARWNEVVVDGDVGNQDPRGTSIGLSLGDEQMGGDFGVFWGSPTENSGDGALGGRIWSDANGDGRSNPGESGIGDVIVSLMNSAIGLQRTVTTDASGFYLFDALPAGAYTITIDTGIDTPLANSSASFDPDNISRPQLVPDNRTSAPLIIAPGDLYSNANFGYQLEETASISGTIITRIYVDTNGNGEFDEGLRPEGTVEIPAIPIGGSNDPILVLGDEPGFANVTVSLANEMGEIVATTRSDENGVAQFNGLPPGSYYVLVSDVDNVLGEIVLFGEPDQIFDGETFVVLTADSTQSAEFGYAPPGHNENAALFGDFIYFDINRNGEYDEGEGVEGVTVQLFDSNGFAYPPIQTNENGRFLFGNITENGRYTVKILPESVPFGLVNTIDPDGGTPLEAEIVFENNVLLNLSSADFGFTTVEGEDDVLGSISGNIWDDLNADGILNDFGGFYFNRVEVRLYLDVNQDGKLDQSSGDRLLSSTMTNRFGAFQFNDLQANDTAYIVYISDESDVLQTYWSTGRTQPNVNSRSQESPYPIRLTLENPVNDTADFGFFRGGGAIGNRIWLDSNNNGIQDVGEESGVPGTVVRLTIRYPNSLQPISQEKDGSGGLYEYYGLGLDESYFDSDEVTYQLTVAYDESIYQPSQIDAHSNELIDSDNPEGEYATLTLGQVNLAMQSNPIAEAPEASYDFGFVHVDDIKETAVSFSETYTVSTISSTQIALFLFCTLLTLTVIYERRSS